MTAGDLIRQALADGETKLGLAKKIAGCNDDRDREVRRWRDVIVRVARGGEPQEPQAARIAEFFGVSEIERRRQGAAQDRLLSLEEAVAHLTDALEVSRRAYALLQRRVSALEKDTQASQSKRRGQSGA